MSPITCVLFACIATIAAHFSCQLGALFKSARVHAVCWLIAMFAFIVSIGFVIGSIQIQASSGTNTTEYTVALIVYILMAGVLWHGLGKN